MVRAAFHRRPHAQRQRRHERPVEPALDPLFEATVEATEEAIANTLVAARTMTGRDGITAHQLPHDRLREVMAKYGRLQA